MRRESVCGDRAQPASSGNDQPTASGRSLYDSKATHLLCVAIGPDGSVYAGGDGEGLIYRIQPDGKATILFDAPQAEVRSLLWAGDGALYAGTAAEAGGGNSARGSLFVTQSGDGSRFLDGTGLDRGAGALRLEEPIIRVRLVACRPRRAAWPGAAAGHRGPRRRFGVTPADHVRRQCRLSTRFRGCTARGLAREGTGARARLGRQSPAGRHRARWPALRDSRPREETSPIARLDSGQILSLLASPTERS